MKKMMMLAAMAIFCVSMSAQQPVRKCDRCPAKSEQCERKVSGSVAKPRKDIAPENDAPFFFFQRSLRNNMVLRTLFF